MSLHSPFKAATFSPRQTSVQPDIRANGRTDQFVEIGSGAGRARTANVLPTFVMLRWSSKKANLEIDIFVASSRVFNKSQCCVRRFHTPKPNCELSDLRPSTNSFPSDSVADKPPPEILSESPILTMDFAFKS